MNRISLLHQGSIPANPPGPTRSPVESVPASTLLAWRSHLKGLGGGDSAGLDWLLEAAAGISRADLQRMALHPQQQQVDLLCQRRELEQLWRLHLSDSVPLQYLVGHCCWRNFELEVGPAVLIPRPETELLIDLALDLHREGGAGPHQHSEKPLWADLGTGSGCLALGMAEALPRSHGFAVDKSSAALLQAQRNLRRSGISSRVTLVQGDWFKAVEPWWGRLQIVLANPPYIPTGTLDHLDPVVRDHEPLMALDGGTDGLSAIRSLIGLAPRALATGGLLVIEHHHDQRNPVLSLLTGHGLQDCRSHRDLEGHWRFASARRP